MPTSVIVHSAHLVSNGSMTDDAWVRFSGGVVTARGVGESWRDIGADDVTDARGRHLTPGFIDLHLHGGGGAAVDDGIEQMRRALDLHAAHGTTRAVISLVSAPFDDLESRLAAVAALSRTDPRVIGSHLEGPFLADSHRGAHSATALRHADESLVARLLAAADGTLVQVTLAPELPGSIAAIHAFVDAGAVVAVGHTAATHDETRAAFSAGATMLTHAFNAMPGIHHRSPGPIVAAFADARVTLEIINDGAHVHPDVVALAFSAAAGRIALVSDAMAAAGVGDGTYRLGPVDVSVDDGIARLAGSDTIAGSTLTLDAALRRAVGDGIPLVDAVDAATIVPARAIGRGAHWGALDVGYAADVVLLGDDLRVAAVWAAGRPVAR